MGLLGDIGGAFGISSKKEKSKSASSNTFQRFPGALNNIDIGRSPLVKAPKTPALKSFSIGDLQNFFNQNPSDPQAAAFKNALTDANTGQTGADRQEAVRTLARIADNLKIGGAQGGTGDVFSPTQQLVKRLLARVDSGDPNTTAAGERAFLDLVNNPVVAPQSGGDVPFAQTPDLVNSDLLQANRPAATTASEGFSQFLDSVLAPENIKLNQSFRNIVDQTVQDVGGRSAVRGLGQPSLAALVGKVAPLETAFRQQQVENRGTLVDKLFQEESIKASFEISQLNSQVDQLKNEQNRLTELSIENARFLDARQKRDLDAKIAALQLEQTRLQEASKVALARRDQNLATLKFLTQQAEAPLIQTGGSQQGTSTSSGANASAGSADAIKLATASLLP